MSDVFISYSRRNKDFTQTLYQALIESNRTIWADWDSIPAASDWLEEIKRGIEETNAVLFVITPEWIKSGECRKELQYAIEMNKRLIPILRQPSEEPLPPELAKINWIYMRDTDDFKQAFQTLCAALDTDLDWVKDHTRIQSRALEWDKKKRDASFLLHGKDLTDAERFIAEAARKEPEVTQLQSEYILASRKDATRRQRMAMGGVSAALVISVVLGIVALFQRQAAVRAELVANKERDRAIAAEAIAMDNEREANRQAKLSRAGELSAQSVIFRDKNFQLSLLLGIQAYHTAETLQTRGTLLDSAQAHPQLYQFLMGHENPVRSVGFSPDGKILASSGEGGTVILWDVVTRKPIKQPLTGSDLVFSPDGKTLATNECNKSDEAGTCIEGKVTLWDVATRQPIGQPLTQPGRVVSMSYSLDGRILAAGGADGSILLWDVANRQSIGQPFKGHTGIVYSVAFSSDGKILASGSADKTIILWDVSTQQMIGEPLTGATGNTSSTNGLAFSPDGKILASGSASYAIILWDVETRQPIGELPMGGTDWVNCLAFSSDGKILASGSSNNSIILWDVATRQRVGQLTGHSGIINSVAFSSDGKTFAAGSKDTSISLWDVSTILDKNAPLRQPIGQRLTGYPVSSVAYSPKGDLLASVSGNESLILWDVASRQRIGQFPVDHPVSQVDFSPDGKTLALGGCYKTDEKKNCLQGEVILWDIAARQTIGEPMFGHDDLVRKVAFSPDGKLIASAGEDSSVILWDVATRKSIGTLKGYTGMVYSVAFSPDGKTLAAGSDDTFITLWDVAIQQPIGNPLEGHTHRVFAVTFSPDGKTLASGSADKTVILWDIAAQKPIGQPLTGHIEAIRALAFSPDGKTLASGSKDSSIILWDVAAHQSMGQPLTGHTNVIDTVAFGPDSQTLASGSKDSTIILWNINLQSWIDQSCLRGGRNFTRDEWSFYIGETIPYQAMCPNLPVEAE